MKSFKVGTIISGTLRPQDLVPTFLTVLDTVAPAVSAQLAVLPFGYIPNTALEDDGDDWWDSIECASKLNELIEVLQDHAPDGTIFGAHPGDAADFGFWPEEMI